MKKAIILLFFLCLLFPDRTSGQSPVSSSVPVGTTNQHKIYHPNASVKTISGIVADIGANTVTAVIYGTLSYGSASTVVSTTTLDLTHGMIDCNNVASAVTIRGPIVAPVGKQIFTNCNNGSISIAMSNLNTKLDGIYTAWWGDIAGDSIDDSAAIQAAINAGQAGYVGPIRILPGQHDIGTALTTTSGATYDFVHIKGENTTRTILMGTSATGNIIEVTGRRTTIEDLTIDGNATRIAGSSGHGIYADNDPSGASATQGHLILRRLNIVHQPQDGIHALDPELHDYADIDLNTNGRYGLYWLESVGGLRPFHNITTNMRSINNVDMGFLCHNCVGGTHINFESYSNGGAAQIDVSGTSTWNNIFINPDIENQTDALNIGGNNIGMRLTGLNNQIHGGHISALVTGISWVDCDGCKVYSPYCTNALFGSPGGFSMDACVKTDALSNKGLIILDTAMTNTGVTAPLSANASITATTYILDGEVRMQGALQTGATPGMLAVASPAPISGFGTGAEVARLRRNTSTNSNAMRLSLAATDTAGNSQEYGGVVATISDSTSTLEDSTIALEIPIAGTLTNALLADLGGVSVKRIKPGLNATAIVAGDFVLSAGWGTTASVGTISGTDQRWQATFTSAGTGQAANPTIAFTYKDGTWTTVPIPTCTRNGGTGAGITGFTFSSTATVLTITAVGTPIAAETYIITCNN